MKYFNYSTVVKLVAVNGIMSFNKRVANTSWGRDKRKATEPALLALSDIKPSQQTQRYNVDIVLRSSPVFA